MVVMMAVMMETALEMIGHSDGGGAGSFKVTQVIFVSIKSKVKCPYNLILSE